MKKLQECKSIQEAQPLLRGSTPTFRKTVETAFTLMGHQDPAQRAIGQGFLSTAIQEMDANEEPTPAQGKFIKPKGEKFVHEAELKDGDKSGNEGSEQSTSNSGPLPKEGTEEPVGDLEAPEMKTEDPRIRSTVSTTNGSKYASNTSNEYSTANSTDAIYCQKIYGGLCYSVERTNHSTKQSNQVPIQSS